MPASKPTRSIGFGHAPRHAAMSLTSHGSSRSSSPFHLPSTMQSAQDRSDMSIPAKYSISHLPCSQSSCDLIGSSTSEQRAALLRMLWALSDDVNWVYGRTCCEAENGSNEPSLPDAAVSTDVWFGDTDQERATSIHRRTRFTSGFRPRRCRHSWIRPAGRRPVPESPAQPDDSLE